MLLLNKNECKIAILSYEYFVSLIDVIWDPINFIQKALNNFVMFTIFAIFSQIFPSKICLRGCNNGWLVVSSTQQSHICDIFRLSPHACTPRLDVFGSQSLWCFLLENNHKLWLQRFQSIVLGGYYWMNWKLDSGFINLTSYLWTGWELGQPMISSYPKCFCKAMKYLQKWYSLK